MRTIIITLASLLALNVSSQSVVIGDTTSTADSSAILDIQSNDKGVLIPRMATVQRELISNAAEGLLVFDSDTKSFWFMQNGSWSELQSGSGSISDTDEDTKVVVEANPDDDTIRIYSGGHQFAKTGGKSLEVGSKGKSVYIGPGVAQSAGDSLQGNVIIGHAAYQNSTSGHFSTVVGDSAVFMNPGTGRMTAFGSKAGMSSSDSLSTFIGFNAGRNATGNRGTYLGYDAGSNDHGSSNTIIGTFAGNDSLTGSANTFVGKSAGSANTTGYGNTFLGQAAGLRNDIGIENTFVGNEAGLFNSSGSRNVLIGYAGRNLTRGSNNIAMGYLALEQDTAIGSAIAIGNSAGRYATSGGLFLGHNAGYSNSGSALTAVGVSAGRSNAGSFNTIIGYSAATDTIAGSFNTIIGASAASNFKSGSTNTILGMNTADAFESGTGNIFLGWSAYEFTSGNLNIAIGNTALSNASPASNVIAIGTSAGRYSSETGGVFIGNSAGYNSTGTNSTFVGNSAGRANRGNNNSAFGDGAARDTLVGDFNSFFGTFAGANLQSGFYNVMLGSSAGFDLENGSSNTIVGNGAGFNTASGSENLFLGTWSAYNNPTGEKNTYVGTYTGYNNSTSRNTYVGYRSGFDASGSDNVFIGHLAGYNETDPTGNKLYIANDSTRWPLIYGDFQEDYLATHGRFVVNSNSDEYMSPRSLVTLTGPNDPALGPTITFVGDNSDQFESGRLRFLEGLAVNNQRGGYIHYDGSGNRFHIGVHDASDDNINNDINVISIVRNTGNLGIRTSNPSEALQVNDGSIYASNLGGNDSNQGFLLGEQTGGPAFGFVYNGTGSGTSNRCHIKKMFGGDTTVIMTFKGNNHVGVGTSDPIQPLDVNGAIRAQDLVYIEEGDQDFSFITNEVGGYVRIDVGGAGHQNDHIIIGDINSPDNNVGIGTASPTALLEVNSSTVKKVGGGSWTASSDIRLKQNIENYSAGLDDVLQIQPVVFQYNELSGYDTNERHVGVIAQELDKIAPYMVSNYTQDGNDYLEVDNSAMTYMLINAVKEQQEVIQELRLRIEILEGSKE